MALEDESPATGEIIVLPPEPPVLPPEPPPVPPRKDEGPVEHSLEGPFGRFATPNFPQSYKQNTNIKWNITVAEGKRIKLTFHLMNVSYGHALA